MKLVLTCEHAGNQIPQAFRKYFEHDPDVLQSHKGYDPGAMDLFKHLTPLADFTSSIEWSRLLIEPNRSLHHPQLFSVFTKACSPKEQQWLLKSVYQPHRHQVERYIRGLLPGKELVLHLSVHSFTPVLEGSARNADIGLLYDPSRPQEKELCKQWQGQLRELAPAYKVRRNYPYRGKADGFTTYLRTCFPQGYLGVELEVNQKFQKENAFATEIKNLFYQSLKQLLSAYA